MKMKSLFTALFAAALCAGMTPAAEAALEVNGGASVGVFDKYLWRGFNLSGSQPVLQSGVDVSAAGFTLSYWTNFQLSAGGGLPNNEVTETDITLDYTAEVGELLSVSVGNIHYSFDATDASTNELYLTLGLNTLLSPALTVYYDWDRAGSADMDGLFFAASIGHTFAVTDALGVSLGALASYNQESPYVGDYSGFHNYELSASLDFALTDQITVSPSFLFSGPISDDAKDVLDEEMVAGLSVSLSF